MKESILSLTHEKLKELLVLLGEPKYRAEQIYYELHNGKKLDEMSNVPTSLKQKLLEDYQDNTIEIIKIQESQDGTKKFLYKLADENLIEGVLMQYKFGYTLCVSTQVGCRMGCKFCASGLDGLVRPLQAGEIMGQVIVANKYLQGSVKERKITNIVLMGSGEPLDNFDNVLTFINLATNKFGLYYAERNISLSTCGLVQKIKELADKEYKINLCLSLHASNNETRKGLMQVAKAYDIKEVVDACKYYFDKTGRRVLIEYILIDNVNCSKTNAIELAKLLKGMNVLVNLINLNEVKENNLKRCSEATLNTFAKTLQEYKINVTTRRSLGNDIDGACGQLRRRYISSR